MPQQVLQIAMKLLLVMLKRCKPACAEGTCLVGADELSKVEAALESAAEVVATHLNTPATEHTIFVEMREQMNKLEQRGLNFEHAISEPVSNTITSTILPAPSGPPSEFPPATSAGSIHFEHLLVTGLQKTLATQYAHLHVAASRCESDPPWRSTASPPPLHPLRSYLVSLANGGAACAIHRSRCCRWNKSAGRTST